MARLSQMISPIDQQRHLAGGGECQRLQLEAGVGRKAVKAQCELFEADAALAHQHQGRMDQDE
jgi:hypothetical protein